MFGPTADIISLAYVIAAIVTGAQLYRVRQIFFANRLTEQTRTIAMQVGFLFLTPLGVLIHELAHLGMAQVFGAHDVSLSFRIYWGFVSYRGALSPTETFLIAAVGPLASVAVGLLAFVAAMRLQAVARIAFWTFGVTTLALILALYPLMSFIGDGGDFASIYSLRTPLLSLLAAGVHGLAIVLALRLNRLIERAAAADRQAIYLD